MDSHQFLRAPLYFSFLIKQNIKKIYLQNRMQKVMEMETQQIVKSLRDRGEMKQSNFKTIIETALKYNKNLPNLLKLNSEVVVVGDIHGQFYDLLNIFQLKGYPPQTNYLFLGDYVDRGNFSVQVITLLFFLQIKFPKAVTLLRGNHQSRLITSSHNFRLECTKKYSIDIYDTVILLFEALPLCCVLNEKFFCVHAGISPALTDLKKIEKIDRFMEVPQKGLLCDILWSDPSEKDGRQWVVNNVRSCSYFYSKYHTETFLKSQKLSMIIRGHEVQLGGYKYQSGKKEKHKCILTLFSAPNYCQKYKNLGAVAHIRDQGLTLQTYKQSNQPYSLPDFKNVFEWTVPYIAKSASQIFVNLMKKKFNFKVEKLKKEDLQKIKEFSKGELKVLCDIVSNYHEKFEQIIHKEETPIDEDSDGDISSNLIRILYFLAQKYKDRDGESRTYSRIDTIEIKQVKPEKLQKQVLNHIFGPKIEKFPKIEFHWRKTIQ